MVYTAAAKVFWLVYYIYLLLVHTYKIIKMKGGRANGWRQSLGFGDIVDIYIKNLG